MGKKVITHICGCKRPFKIPSYSKQNMKKYHSEWGKLYGYPHSAIQAFIQNNTLRYDKYKRDAEQLLVYLQEIEDSNFNLNYLQLISFLPANSTNGIQDAIDISYKYKKLLYEMSHNYELPHFSKLLQFQIETEKPSQLYLTN